MSFLEFKFKIRRFIDSDFGEWVSTASKNNWFGASIKFTAFSFLLLTIDEAISTSISGDFSSPSNGITTSASVFIVSSLNSFDGEALFWSLDLPLNKKDKIP